jgi:hypothetical protein
MDPLLLLNPMNITTIYNYFKGRKEKSDTILEPLQACIQLAYLDFCPIGTKLSLDKNILYIDIPNFTQSMRRYMNSYKKTDIHYLFNVLHRYIKWYKQDDKFACLVEILDIHMICGLENLVKTYEKTDDPTILHTLNMYITLLKSKNNISDFETDNDINDINNVNFCRIKEMYSDELINIIINTFTIMNNSSDNDKIIYINGLETLLKKNKIDIQNFIRTKVLCI